MKDRIKIKSLFLSDLHMGVKHNNVKTAIGLLDMYEFENLFLLGDIIDMTSLKRRAHWKKSYGDFIKKLISLSKTTNIVYLTGNHDYYLREFTPFCCGVCDVRDEYIYKGRLLIHGDKFDTLIYKRRYLYALGDFGYNFVIWLDKFLKFNGVLSKSAKRWVKATCNYLDDFYGTAAKYTKSKDCHTVICGHTHHQEYRLIDDVKYYNCGDFRESKAYLIEDLNSNLILKTVE